MSTAPDFSAEFDDMIEGEQWPMCVIPMWVALAPVSPLARAAYYLLRVYAMKSPSTWAVALRHGTATLAEGLGGWPARDVALAEAELELIGAITRMPEAGADSRTRYYLHPEPRPEAAYSGPRHLGDRRHPG